MNNPKSRQQWILEQLTRRPTLSFGECFSEYSVIYSRTEKTFSTDWNKSKEKHIVLQGVINAAKEQAVISEEVQAAKNGLKSKHERLMTLQRQVDATESELNDGRTKETVIRGGKGVSIDRDFTVLERAQLRRTLKDLQSEISKIEGDYAATKIQGIGAIAFTPIPEKL